MEPLTRIVARQTAKPSSNSGRHAPNAVNGVCGFPHFYHRRQLEEPNYNAFRFGANCRSSVTFSRT